MVISASGANAQYWADLWHYRELLYLLAWRDIIVRYKQTALGIVWALIQPLLTLIVFTVVFGRVAKLPSSGSPYALLVLSGLLPWQFFSQAVSSASASLLGSSGLVSKIYFPRLLVPAAATATALVDFAISAVLMAILMAYYRFIPDYRILFLPLFVLLALLIAAAVGLWFSALTVNYRDFRFVVPFSLQLGLFLSPVGFTSHVVSSKYQLLYALNPMVGVINGFRWSLLRGQESLSVTQLLVSSSIAVLFLASGARYFRTMERNIADTL